MARETLGWRGFEGEEEALGGSGATLVSGSFDADAEELAALCQGVRGGVEEQVAFVGTGCGDGGVQAAERAAEFGGIGEAEFDFGLDGHGDRV
jgi:hypothetical protein